MHSGSRPLETPLRPLKRPASAGSLRRRRKPRRLQILRSRVAQRQLLRRPLPRPASRPLPRPLPRRPPLPKSDSLRGGSSGVTFRRVAASTSPTTAKWTDFPSKPTRAERPSPLHAPQPPLLPSRNLSTPSTPHPPIIPPSHPSFLLYPFLPPPFHAPPFPLLLPHPHLTPNSALTLQTSGRLLCTRP